MWKKIVLILCCCTIIVVWSISKEKTTQLVLNEIEKENEYQKIYLSFPNHQLTTKNFETIFQNEKVLIIYPEINPIYKEKIKEDFAYQVKENSSLEKLEEHVKTSLKKYGYQIEENGKGIGIEKVLFYGTLEKVNQIKQKYPTVTYSFTKNGIYQ